MQVELLDSRRWKTRVELANGIFEYIEVFHNRRRRHSSLGMLTPIEFELNKITTTTDARRPILHRNRAAKSAPLALALI